MHTSSAPRDRPLARGEIAPWEALARRRDASRCAHSFFVLRTNQATILLSVPALVIAVVYPFFKRFFALPQAFLGIAFSFGIPMAFAAIYLDGSAGRLVAVRWLNLFWVIAYDTEYAMVDRDDDMQARPQDVGDHVRPFRRAGRHALLCALSRRIDLGRASGAISVRSITLAGSRRRCSRSTITG